MKLTKEQAFFVQALLQWHEQTPRPMPWKANRYPYPIWLSEIILQQTRVAQGMPYFERFIEQFPSVFDLAVAPEDQVLKLWEGLGYYSRARNLHKAAKQVAALGAFPDDYDGLLALSGVGPYTAAAVASFAYDAHVAVVDGNVQRVLARFEGIADPIDTNEGKKKIQKLADALLPKGQSAKFNQAIMNFGALQCVPSSPRCISCCMSEHCVAFLDKKVSEYPVKSKQIKRKDRHFNYFFLQRAGNLFVNKRTNNDIWNGLHELPMYETDRLFELKDLQQATVWKDLCADQGSQVQISEPMIQLLTHQRIIARVVQVVIPSESEPKYPGIFEVSQAELLELAFPRVLRHYFDHQASADLF